MGKCIFGVLHKNGQPTYLIQLSYLKSKSLRMLRWYSQAVRSMLLDDSHVFQISESMVSSS
jgi:hypothetical protein